MWIIDHFETFWEHRKAIWCIETQLAEKFKFGHENLAKSHQKKCFTFFKFIFFIFLLLLLLLLLSLLLLLFFFKLNSTLDTFADKSLPGKYYRDVDKSDYWGDFDILTCEDINGALLRAVKMSCFLFHGHLQYCYNYNTSRILRHQNCNRDLKT